MIAYELGSAILKIAQFSALIYFGVLVYKKVPENWAHPVKLLFSILIPLFFYALLIYTIETSS